MLDEVESSTGQLYRIDDTGRPVLLASRPVPPDPKLLFHAQHYCATFHQLDVKVEKAFHLGALTLAPYREVQNVYNAKNPEGYSYNYDYTKREQANGLGLFPNLGVRGEL